MTGAKKEPADERLTHAVKSALWRSEPIRALDLDTIHVVARGGTVVLRGLVASDAHKHAAAQLARGVPGVADVVNELVTDVELERHVALALASDRTTRGQRISVKVAGGVASLYGAVPAPAVAEQARRVALGVPGLIGVESHLRVVPPGDTVILAWQHSVEGRPQRPQTPVQQREAPDGPSDRAAPADPAPATRLEGAA